MSKSVPRGNSITLQVDGHWLIGDRSIRISGDPHPNLLPRREKEPYFPSPSQGEGRVRVNPRNLIGSGLGGNASPHKQMNNTNRAKPNPGTSEFARTLRRSQSPIEARLWARLRNRYCGGFKFRRQAAFGKYVADFYCADAKLIVEIDGNTHDMTVESDAQRNVWFDSQGYRTLRFTHRDVLEQLDGVLVLIHEVCVFSKTLIPTFSPEGRRSRIFFSPSKGEGRVRVGMQGTESVALARRASDASSAC